MAFHEISITAHQHGTVAGELSQDGPILTLGAESTILLIRGYQGEAVELDGLSVQPSRVSGEALLSLDLSRSVGYHYLKVGPSLFAFATEDGKLRLSGMFAILEQLDRSGLAWGQQLQFSTGEGVASPQVQFAWLWRHIGTITAALDSIRRAPGSRQVDRPVLSTTANGRIDVRRTLRFLRRNPTQLEERPTGTIGLSNGRRYTPRAVVLKRRRATLATIANARAAFLGQRVVAIAQALSAIVPAPRWNQMHKPLARLKEILRGDVFQSSIRRYPSPTNLSPEREELTDSRYEVVLERLSDLRRAGWDAAEGPHRSMFAFVKHSDELYQAYVAVTVAAALGCSLCVPEIRPRLTSPIFQSDRFAIYYDTEPPPEVALTWRSLSSRPDNARPDLLIVDTLNRKCLIVDAKYRSDKNNASADSLREVQYYLNSFDMTAIVIGYPPNEPTAMALGNVQAQENRILELPIYPRDEVVEFLTISFLPELETLWQNYSNETASPPANSAAADISSNAS